MRTPILKGATLAAAMLICSCGASPQAPGEGDRDANARAFELHPEKNFAKLINAYTVGKIEPTPWAGWWWAYTSNGIAKGIGSASPAG
ncbi:MAG: hypothetical protein ACXVBW_04060, partial [Bdellovibrionota bacterium]